jgi:hypothetical protein
MKHEFKVTKSQNQTVYTLESASSGGTSSGGIASVSTALGGTQRRKGDNLLAQEANKKKETSKPRNFVAKNAKMGGAGAHKDKKKAEKQGDVKHKKPFMESDEVCPQCGKKGCTCAPGKCKCTPLPGFPKKQNVAESFNGEYDDEAGMAHSNLLTSARAVLGLLKTIKDRDNLPEWAQEKIAKAEMMLVGVWDYLQSQKEQGIDPQQGANENRYDRRDAYQRDYDSSVSGMDGSYHRAFKRAEMDHELGHERNNYAVAIDGRTWKVFADRRQAENIARSLKAKGKNASVHETGADPTESVAEEAPKGWEGTVKAMKKHKEIDNPYALTNYMKNKGYKSHKKESVDPYFEELMSKVEEIAKK